MVRHWGRLIGLALLLEVALNIAPMRENLSKVVAEIILPLFLFVSAISFPGFAWCYGEDGHTEAKYFGGKNCCFEEAYSQSETSPHTSSKYVFDGKNCGPCLDYLVFKDVSLSKRLNKQSSEKDINLEATKLPSPSYSDNKILFNKLIHNQIPRVSQTILAHRKVVLLN